MNNDYQDPEFPNLKHISIGIETWEVAGVWFTTDASGKSYTEAIGIRPVPPATYHEPVKKITVANLRAAILNGHF